MRGCHVAHTTGALQVVAGQGLDLLDKGERRRYNGGMNNIDKVTKVLEHPRSRHGVSVRTIAKASGLDASAFLTNPRPTLGALPETLATLREMRAAGTVWRGGSSGCWGLVRESLTVVELRAVAAKAEAEGACSKCLGAKTVSSTVDNGRCWKCGGTGRA